MNNFDPTKLVLIFISISSIIICVQTKEKIGKKITDYNDADLHKLLDQWNENDEDDDGEDDDDPRLKTPPKVNMDEILKSGGDKEQILKASKKGQPMMIFANVAGNPTKKQTESITSLWQTSLQNNQIQVKRYVVSDKRVLFQLDDGSQAFEIKDYLVTLDTVESVSFENMEFPGKGAAKKGAGKNEL